MVLSTRFGENGMYFGRTCRTSARSEAVLGELDGEAKELLPTIEKTPFIPASQWPMLAVQRQS